MKKLEKINKTNVEDVIRLSTMQEGILYHVLSNPDTEQYITQLSIRLTGKVDTIHFIHIWERVIQDNEMLRTVFAWERINKPVQMILKKVNPYIKIYDFSFVDSSQWADMIETVRDEDRREKFDLNQGPLFRVRLCKLAEDQYEIVISNHHIIYDGWSTGIILKEFFGLYNNKIQIKKKRKFKDYLLWASKQDSNSQESYWTQYLEGLESQTPLPLDCKKEREVSSTETYSYKLPEEICQNINDLVNKEKITLGSFFITCWGILLQRYANSEDVLFGTTFSGRSPLISGIEDIVGLFINSLPLRVKCQANESISNLLFKINQSIRSHSNYETTPLVDIKKYSQLDKMNSLFDSLVVIENYPLEQQLSLQNQELCVLSTHVQEMTNFDLVLQIMAFNQIEIHLQYNKELFLASTIERLFSHLVNIMVSVLMNPHKQVSTVELLSAEEKEFILYDFNETFVEYPKDKLIYQLFEEQVEKYGNDIALLHEGGQITYAELNQKVNQLSHLLRSKGIGPNKIVAVVSDRSPEMILGIYAILKAGGAYLPIDPNFPAERIQYILQDSAVTLMLVDSSNQLKLQDVPVQILNLSLTESYYKNRSNPESINSSQDLAYVIYTSGSTGNPKGVMIEHRNMLNILLTLQSCYPVDPGDVYLFKTPYTFDVSVTEIFGWFFNGATLGILSKDKEKDPKAIIQAIQKFGVTHINFVPSMFRVFLDMLVDSPKLTELRYILVAGEPLSRDLVEQFDYLYPNITLENLYGPTEATVYATRYSLKHATCPQNVPIGKPLSNVKTYILNNHNGLQPIGVEGELCIAGLGLARGYLSRSELTAQKFVPNPFVSGELMYKTGDLAKWLPDGNIEYLGRIDRQVKIRGYRIEIGEIELCLLKNPDVENVVVEAKMGENEDKYLVAYVVCRNNITIEGLKDYLLKQLPVYMVPTHFVFLAELPLLSNGKIDRKKLLSLDCAISLTEYVAPQNETEHTLSDIWCNILHCTKVGTRDNFFMLGGHSLNAIQMLAQIEKTFNVELTLKALFQNPTIAQLALIINQQNIIEFEQIIKQTEQENYELSYSQNRLWMLTQKEPDTESYIIWGLSSFAGKLDRIAFKKAIQSLVNRHESLRTSFSVVSRKPRQVIHHDREILIGYHDFRQETNKEEKAKQVATLEANKPFDLEKDCLFRVSLFQLEDEKYYILLAVHHIIADGWSLSILEKEINHFYNAYESGTKVQLADLKTQYKDFAIWHNQLMVSDQIQSQKDFWHNYLAGTTYGPKLPSDYPYSQENLKGDLYQIHISPEERDALKKLVVEHQGSLYMLLLASFTLLLWRLTNQQEIVIGAPVAGRIHEDTKQLVGYFLNTVVFRQRMDENERFGDFLKRVIDNTIRVLENQSYPFDLLVDEMELYTTGEEPSITSVFFNMLNFDMEAHSRFERLTFSQFKPGQTVKQDLACYITDYHEGLLFECVYRKSLFKESTIKYIFNEYYHLLKEILRHPNKIVKRYDVFSSKSVNPDPFVMHFLQMDERVDSKAYQQSIVSHFELQVEKNASKIAVKTPEKQLSYSTLNQLANAIGQELLARFEVKSKEQHRIALLFEQNAEMPAAIFGVLKTGSIYVPLDPKYPEKRLNYMLRDSGATFIVTNSEYEDLAIQLANNEMIIINIDNLERTNHKENLNLIVSPDAVAYILYTSGSTGEPKGVYQSHRNVLHFISTYTSNLRIRSNDRLTLFSSFSFDAAVMDIFSALLNGATLYPLRLLDQGAFSMLADWLIKEEITIYHSIPTVFRYFSKQLRKDIHFPKLRFIVLGGETALKSDVTIFKDYFSSHTIFVNGLGPTESTVTLQYFVNKNTEITKWTVPVGYPVCDTEVYILNENDEEVSVFGIGELVFRSPYLALGYWNKPDLTRKTFTVDPIRGEGRVYRSGDLGRLLPDGSIEYIGRKDLQIKVRGHRVDINEIEAIVNQIVGIKQCVVIGSSNSEGENYLVGYYLVEEDAKITEKYIKEQLSLSLPSYMIPVSLIELKQMPYTRTGKVDRKALPVPGLVANVVAPQTEIEIALVDIWSKVLKINKIGIHDNFFDLGGHSLKAIRLADLIYQELGVEFSLKEIFTNPTVAEMALRLEEAEKCKYPSIEPTLKREYYPLSPAQKRLYILNQLDENSTSYNMPIALFVEGNLDCLTLTEAFHVLIQRQESLRTSFSLKDGEIIQIIHDSVEFNIEYVKEGLENNVEKEIRNFIKPFDLTCAPLMHVKMIRYPERYLLLMDMHHIISDGTSQYILLNELSELLKGNKLHDLLIQYKDFVIWQDSYLRSKIIGRQEAFWLNELSGELPVLNLPTDFSRPTVIDDQGDTILFTLDQETTSKLHKLANATGATLFMILLSGYFLQLARYTGQEDIIVGLPSAGRTKPLLDDIIGMFVNTLVLRANPQGEKPFLDFLNEIKSKALQAYQYQDYPFEELVNKLDIQRDMGRNPVFDTMFTLQNMEMKEIQNEGLKFAPVSFKSNTSKFDLSLTAMEKDDALHFIFEYRTSLFKLETIERFAEHFRNILAELADRPDQKLCNVQMMSEQEQNLLLNKFNTPQMAYPKEMVLSELFEEQACKTPEKVAVVYNGRGVTYQVINQKANQLARKLLERSIIHQVKVGLLLDPSLEMIIGMLATLKAGGTYVPLEPDLPEERLKFILEDSELSILLTQKKYIYRATGIDTVFNLEEEENYDAENTNLGRIASCSDIAYIIYTSGSTGKPKGVEIRHCNIVNQLYGLLGIGIEPALSYILLASYTFDASLEQIFLPLITGGELHLVDKEIKLNAMNLLNYLMHHNIDVVDTVPSLMEVLADAYEDKEKLKFKYIILGGDIFSKNLYHKIRSKFDVANLINTYGPTETTVNATYYHVKDIGESNIPIGLPMPNYRLYILDKYSTLLPLGVAGELCIAGEGVAKGYLNRSELTGKVFVPDPFVPGERMYRTGDLVRWEPEGTLQFLGRIDNQVKIRGFRIELGEIETRMLKHNQIEDVVVLAKEGLNGHKYLCAFYVSKDELSVSELRNFLLIELPEYMIPVYFIRLDHMPLNPNGKMNRNALPDPEGSVLVGAEYEEPQGEVERKLAEIWALILGISKIGRNDNFFELGGHSLNATQINFLIHKYFHVQLGIQKLFQNATLASLAECIQEANQSLFTNITALPRKDYYEISWSQKRMWLFQKADFDSPSFNISGFIPLEEPVNLSALEKAFESIIIRHEGFRTYFKEVGGRPVQVIVEKVNFTLELIDVAHLSIDDQTLQRAEIVKKVCGVPFNLEQPPLFRAKLIKYNDDRFELVFTIHHIIFDGWSMEILKKEFFELYMSYCAGREVNFEPLPIHYKDFVGWQNQVTSDSLMMQKVIDFWGKQLAGKLPVVRLATDYSPSNVKTRQSAAYRLVISDELLNRMRNIAEEYQVSLFVLILACFKLFLKSLTGQNDILIGLPAAGREHENLRNIIGYFINTILLRSKLDPEEPFVSFLSMMRNNVFASLEYQSIPVETILESLNIWFPTMPIFFNMLNIGDTNLHQLDDLESYHIDHVKSVNFDMTYYITEYANGLEISCHYLRELFEPHTVAYMMKKYQETIEEVTCSPTKSIEDLANLIGEKVV